MRLALIIGFAVFAAFYAPVQASAQAVEAASELYFTAEFEDARTAFERILDDEDASKTDITDSHRYLVTLYALMSQGEEARAAARAAVALDPSVEPVAGSPAQAADLLNTARADTPPLALSITAQAPFEEGDDVVVVASVEGHLAGTHRVLVVCEGDDLRERTTGEPRSVTLPLDRVPSEFTCHAEARNRAGATLLELDEELEEGGVPSPSAVAAAAEDGDDRDDDRDRDDRRDRDSGRDEDRREREEADEEGGGAGGWIAFGVIAAGLIAGGVYAAIYFTSDASFDSPNTGGFGANVSALRWEGP